MHFIVLNRKKDDQSSQPFISRGLMLVIPDEFQHFLVMTKEPIGENLTILLRMNKVQNIDFWHSEIRKNIAKAW